MKFRTKLLLTFIVVGLLTNGISLGLLYYLARQSLYDFYRAKLLSITVSVASMIDGESLKTIQTTADANKPAYAELRDTLRKGTRRQPPQRYLYAAHVHGDAFESGSEGSGLRCRL